MTTLGQRIKAHKEETKVNITDWLTKVIEQNLDAFLVVDKVEIILPEAFEDVKSTVLQVATEQDLSIDFTSGHTKHCTCYLQWGGEGSVPKGCQTTCSISVK